MGRFISEAQPYQRHDLPTEMREYGIRQFWAEYVGPRGPFSYDAPLVVLVGRWTGSMGEGLAIGLDGMDRATVIGMPMARLRGALYEHILPHTGIPRPDSGGASFPRRWNATREFHPSASVCHLILSDLFAGACTRGARPGPSRCLPFYSAKQNEPEMTRESVPPGSRYAAGNMQRVNMTFSARPGARSALDLT